MSLQTRQKKPANYLLGYQNTIAYVGQQEKTAELKAVDELLDEKLLQLKELLTAFP